MLLLGRKVGKNIDSDIVLSWAGQDVVVRVTSILGDKVRLGIIADRAVQVHRREVYEGIHGRKPMVTE